MSNIDKQAQGEKTREAFERWAEQSGALPWGILKKHRNQDGTYPGPHYTYMWHAWNACHEALLDELEAADNTVAQLNNEICNLLPGVQYMDPPDGGSVTPIEQVQRMVVDYREQMEAAEKTSAARLEAIDRTHKMFQREKDRADAAEKRNAEMESLLSAIGKSRPGGAYFCKWDGKINEVLNHGK